MLMCCFSSAMLQTREHFRLCREQRPACLLTWSLRKVHLWQGILIVHQLPPWFNHIPARLLKNTRNPSQTWEGKGKKAGKMKMYANDCPVNLTYQSPNHTGLKGLEMESGSKWIVQNIQILRIPLYLICLHENINALCISLPGMQRSWSDHFWCANSIIYYFLLLSQWELTDLFTQNSHLFL